MEDQQSHGQKIISLFATLLFSRRKYSLTELSKSLQCSKQTVLRLIDVIQTSYSLPIEETKEGNRNYYQIITNKKIPKVEISQEEISLLYMCKSFTENLLGKKLFNNVNVALGKSIAPYIDDASESENYFSSFKPGSIDYTPYQNIIITILKSMEAKKVCKIQYKSMRSMQENKVRTFYIKPYKLFSHHDTMYLHAGLGRTPGKAYKEPVFNPLLTIHRFISAELTDILFKIPNNYNFEATYNKHFGIITEKAFKTEILFSDYAAQYVAERIWSPDQILETQKDGKLKITFSSSSKPELMAWVLSFGADAKVIKPDWLVKEIKARINKMKNNYNK